VTASTNPQRTLALVTDALEAPANAAVARVVDMEGPMWFEEWPGPRERTFVLLHGLGGSHLNWRLVAPALAARGRVLVPDLVGFGRTPRAGRSSSVAANRRVLSRFLAEVATGDVVVAGNSMGGALALLLAAFEPGSVSGVVPTSPVLPWVVTAAPAPIVVGGFTVYRIPAVGEWVVRGRFRRLPAERAVRLGFRLTMRDPAAVPDELVRAHVELTRERQSDADAPAAFLEGARSILRLLRPRGAYRATLDTVRCPVLLIHGARDRFVPAAYARAARRSHPRWELRMFPDVGHVPQLEAPDRWLREVLAWLDGRAARA
jgi:pimeloyl-ACP methyl ester carboxylesterase